MDHYDFQSESSAGYLVRRHERSHHYDRKLPTTGERKTSFRFTRKLIRRMNAVFQSPRGGDFAQVRMEVDAASCATLLLVDL